MGCGCPLALGRVSQAQLPRTNYHCSSWPCLPRAPAFLTTGPMASSECASMNMLAAGGGGTGACGCVCLCVCLHEWACAWATVSAWEVGASVFLHLHLYLCLYLASSSSPSGDLQASLLAPTPHPAQSGGRDQGPECVLLPGPGCVMPSD